MWRHRAVEKFDRLCSRVSAHFFGVVLILRVLWRRYGHCNDDADSRNRGGGGSDDSATDLIPGFVINLASRPDRYLDFRKTAESVGLANITRLEGIPHENGTLGCALAHLKVLETFASTTDFEMGFVFEDDIKFEIGAQEFWEIVNAFRKNRNLDVLCLGSLSYGYSVSISAELKVSATVQGRPAYLVKKRALGPLLRDYRRGVRLLEGGKRAARASQDVTWRRAQRKELFFCVPRRRVGGQRPSFSDIQKRWVHYRSQ